MLRVATLPVSAFMKPGLSYPRWVNKNTTVACSSSSCKRDKRVLIEYDLGSSLPRSFIVHNLGEGDSGCGMDGSWMFMGQGFDV